MASLRCEIQTKTKKRNNTARTKRTKKTRKFSS